MCSRAQRVLVNGWKVGLASQIVHAGKVGNAAQFFLVIVYRNCCGEGFIVYFN